MVVETCEGVDAGEDLDRDREEGEEGGWEWVGVCFG
jgi:hypothetical protein